ncbi:hypothetical protein SLS57_007240 [Botryosphaeria dothidea]
MSSSAYNNGPATESGRHWDADDNPKAIRHSEGTTMNDPRGSPEVDEVGLQVNSESKPLPFPFNRIMESSFGTSRWKNHVIAMIGEAVGTGSFLFFAFAGTEVALYGKASGQTDTFDPAVVLYIALSFGLSLMVNVFIFFRVSGGLFNPAVTLAMLLTSSIPPMRCFCLFVAQMLACMFSSYIVSVLIPTEFGVVTAPSNGASTAQAVCIEFILTAYLCMSIFMLAGENHKGRFMAPVCIGMALFSAHLVGVQWTGASLNPCRSFGPAIVSGNWKQHWIYWVGPGVGAILAAGLYKTLKHMRYEEANPGQDAYDEPAPRRFSVHPGRK